jgi:hypothetical protein
MVMSKVKKKKYPTGEEVVRDALRRSDRRCRTVPPVVEELFGDCANVVRLAALCRELQRRAKKNGKDDFPLAGSLAAMVLGVRHELAVSGLKALLSVGVIELTEQGSWGVANRYRYVDDPR